jgi:hypothetical protein
MFERQKFAPSHNNAANAKAFKELSPPLFADYERALPQQWRDYDGVRLTGRRLDRPWGKPSLSLTFGRLTRAELAYLKTLVGYATIYCLNESLNTWLTYNATLRQLDASDFEKRGNAYIGVRLEFIDLVEI